MYWLKCPILQNSKAVRDMVLLLMSASTSAEHDIVDQFAIVAKPNLYKEYSDGDDEYCPSPLD
jgi:hypothetical protein